jgi:hypothetical protein
MTDMEDLEEEIAFREIDKMQEHGLNAADINKLKEAGMHTVASVLMW